MDTGRESAETPSNPVTPPAGFTARSAFADRESEDEYFLRLSHHFYLPYEMVKEAKEVFDKYRNLDAIYLANEQRDNTKVEAVTSHVTASGQSPSPSSSCHHLHSRPPPLQTPGSEALGVSAITVNPNSPLLPFNLSGTCDEREDQVGIIGLQAFYRDLGVPKSALEIADVVQRMRSYPEEFSLLKRCEAEERELEARKQQELQRNETDRSSSHSNRPASKKTKSKEKRGEVSGTPTPSQVEVDRRAEGPSVVPSVFGATSETPMPGRVSICEPSQQAGRGLPFSLFLFLLQSKLRDDVDDSSMGSKTREIKEVFRALDADRDGVLSDQDIQRALVYLLEEEGIISDDRDLVELGTMHPVALRAALMECDMNGDGLVTLDDFLTVMMV